MWVQPCGIKVLTVCLFLSVLFPPLHAVYIWGISGIFGLLVLYLSYTHSFSFASFICVNVLYCKTFPGETQHTHLPTPAKERMTRPRGHSQSPTWWNTEFYWEYLQEYGWRVLRSREDSKTVALPRPTPAWWQLLKAGNLQPLHCPQAAWPLGECPCALCRWLWSNPLPGSLASLGGRSPVNVVSFRNFLRLFCVVCLPAYGASMQDGVYQTWRKLRQQNVGFSWTRFSSPVLGLTIFPFLSPHFLPQSVNMWDCLHHFLKF